jgi:hypothetical protein
MIMSAVHSQARDITSRSAESVRTAWRTAPSLRLRSGDTAGWRLVLMLRARARRPDRYRRNPQVSFCFRARRARRAVAAVVA